MRTPIKKAPQLYPRVLHHSPQAAAAGRIAASRQHQQQAASRQRLRWRELPVSALDPASSIMRHKAVALSGVMNAALGLLVVLLLRPAPAAVAQQQPSQLVAAAAPAVCQDVVHDINYAGNDLRHASPAASAGACCAMCEADASCVYYTFCPQCTSCPGSGKGLGCCHLKTSKAGAVHSSGRTSGQSSTFKPSPPPPPPPPSPPPAPPAPPNSKNVLFIMADDLRPQLSAAYGHSWLHTPNIDQFTSTATVFLRAYVQQQVCSPSRNSFMTGRRPDATGVYNFNSDFRISRPTWSPRDTRPGKGANFTTMPQYFKQHGYQVYPDRACQVQLPCCLKYCNSGGKVLYLLNLYCTLYRYTALANCFIPIGH
jgi:hypothetical protein